MAAATGCASSVSHSSNLSESGFCVKETGQDKGRAVFALKEYDEGDVIFEEDPLVCAQFLWNADYHYIACDFCLKSLESAEEMARRLCGNKTLVLPHAAQCWEGENSSVLCQKCKVIYCSEECRSKALEQYHHLLCLGHPGHDPGHPLVKLQEMWKYIHYPPETANIMLVARMIATVLQASDKNAAKEVFNTFCHSVINKEQHIAHKLLGLQFQDQLDQLRLLLSEALYDEAVAEWLSPEGFLSIFALVGTNGQGIGTSSFSVYANKVDSLPGLSDDEQKAVGVFLDDLYEEMGKVSGIFLDCEGAGLYRLQSSCNHNCNPNAEVTFPNNSCRLVLKALKHVSIGEEICISYLNPCELDRSRHSRQKYLRENYLFNCTCEKCELQANDPDETSSDEDDDDNEIQD